MGIGTGESGSLEPNPEVCELRVYSLYTDKIPLVAAIRR